MDTAIHMIYQIAHYRVPAIVIALFLFLLLTTRKKLFILGLCIVVLAVLNFIFGYRLGHYLIHTYGEDGTARITGVEKINRLYTTQPVKEYRVVIRTLNDKTVNTVFKNNVLNVYPTPKTGYTYPRQGIPFSIKYIKTRPHIFVIVLQ